MATYTLSSFKHRITVCSMKDVIIAGGEISLARQDIYPCWAAIIPSVKTMFNAAGSAIKQSRDVRTHILVLRMRRDMDFTQAAWFYEQRLQSGGRWFKMLAMVDQNERGQYLECDVRLVERGFEMSQPQGEPDGEGVAAGLMTAKPSGVQL